MEPRFAAIPILRIFDIDKARQFYIDWLGFRIDWEHRSEPDLPIYLQISRQGFRLHLSEHHGDACPGAKVFVVTADIHDLHRELTEKRYAYNRPAIEDAPWGAKTIEVTDPFGNRLLFNEYPAGES